METTEEDGGAIASITSLSRDELVARWKAIYGRAPPKGTGQRLLVLAIAYHVQAGEQGGLKKRARDALLQSEAPRRRTNTRQSHKPSTGGRLIREWHGESHVVDVLDGGYLYRGETYSSLSKIACLITGAKWSGPRFFGVTGR